MSFDLLAPHYRWMELVLAGRKLQRCRTAFLEQARDARNALILGEGNGRFLEAFLRLNPECRVTCLDASQRMLQIAQERLLRKGLDMARVHFIHADIRDWNNPSGSHDLVVSHFFLDCFPAEQLERIIGNISSATQPGARWLLADFAEPTAGWKRSRARLILASMYAFFQRATALPAGRLTAPDAFLNRHGFRLRERVETEWGLLRSDLWQRA